MTPTSPGLGLQSSEDYLCESRENIYIYIYSDDWLHSYIATTIL